jgi:hypothetical protein
LIVYSLQVVPVHVPSPQYTSVESTATLVIDKLAVVVAIVVGVPPHKGIIITV